ncbi:hypothetical protein B0G84_7903 [Paraburkholderia sp. BL8N3]|nr:hypothetical protein [Paraburkholderia sp. BL8N3]TCK33624.1 hypothetical protein B0G84_7903 [Paraburkholderia sp. BL8N3]
MQRCFYFSDKQVIVGRDGDAARLAWEKLREDYPDGDTLVSLDGLIGELGEDAAAPFADHQALQTCCRRLDAEIEPAARRLFGDAPAHAWLALCWRARARRAAALPFCADAGEHHAAALWLGADDWPAAREAVELIEAWRRIPVPLAWMAEARYRTEGLEAAWPLLTELAWLSPRRFADLLKRLADASLDALHRRFDAQFDGAGGLADLAWFPAWLLIEKPSLAPTLRTAQPSRQTSPERATRLVLQILDLERRGSQPELVERRRALRDMHAGLYAAYMKTR